eukprot:TRINITY_DN19755_c0_g1_i1.p1 TRINITY_DN19755_c0_g1~~TRINITY_DN19755_c0_g1_i1.p1  ORF type:complete len:134 (-),score=16.23 TRINITY_DN19755_c0_g1_i1:24-425(-)
MISSLFIFLIGIASVSAGAEQICYPLNNQISLAIGGGPVKNTQMGSSPGVRGFALLKNATSICGQIDFYDEGYPIPLDSWIASESMIVMNLPFSYFQQTATLLQSNTPIAMIWNHDEGIAGPQAGLIVGNLNF